MNDDLPSLDLIQTSADIGEIAKVLPEAQAAIAKITRDASNPHFNSKYASLTEIAEALLPAMNKHGIAVVQGVSSVVGAVRVTTRLQHTSTQFFQTTHTVPVARNDAQGIGSALSYAKRQALQAFLVMAPQGEDDDGEGAVGRGQGSKPPLPPPPARPALGDRLARLEKTLDDVKTVRDLTKAWDLAKALRAEIGVEDPERAARLEALHDRRHGELVGGAG